MYCLYTIISGTTYYTSVLNPGFVDNTNYHRFYCLVSFAILINSAIYTRKKTFCGQEPMLTSFYRRSQRMQVLIKFTLVKVPEDVNEANSPRCYSRTERPTTP